MPHKAKILIKSKSPEVHKQAGDAVGPPRPKDWYAYLASGPVASGTFMQGIDELPAQDREP